MLFSFIRRMTNTIYETEDFGKRFEKLNQDEKEWIKKMAAQLVENSEVGKPLKGKWLKEKKYKNKRLYYTVYENWNKILIVAFGLKKDQKQMIADIVQNKVIYEKYVQTI